MHNSVNPSVDFGRRSVEALLCENADYLVNALSLRLRRLHDNPAAPDVMRVVLQHSNRDVLPLLRDTVQEVRLGVARNVSPVATILKLKCLSVWWKEVSTELFRPSFES